MEIMATNKYKHLLYKLNYQHKRVNSTYTRVNAFHSCTYQTFSHCTCEVGIHLHDIS